MKLVMAVTAETVRVALVNNQEILAEQHWSAGVDVGLELLRVIESWRGLYPQQFKNLTSIMVDRGSGRYGALRACHTVATMLALAWRLPLAAGQLVSMGE